MIEGEAIAGELLDKLFDATTTNEEKERIKADIKKHMDDTKQTSLGVRGKENYLITNDKLWDRVEIAAVDLKKGWQVKINNFYNL